MIADGGYDSDPLRFRLRKQGTRLICPHKKSRVRSATQNGASCATIGDVGSSSAPIGWLGNYRRLVVRYDRSLTIYRGFFHIASFMIVLRMVLQ